MPIHLAEKPPNVKRGSPCRSGGQMSDKATIQTSGLLRWQCVLLLLGINRTGIDCSLRLDGFGCRQPNSSSVAHHGNRLMRPVNPRAQPCNGSVTPHLKFAAASRGVSDLAVIRP